MDTETKEPTMINIHIAKINRTLAIDWDSLPESSKQYIIQYGLKQRFNDCHSQFKSPDDAAAIVDKTLEGLLSGNIRVNASRLAPIDKALDDVISELVLGRRNKSGEKITRKMAKTLGHDKILAAVAKAKGMEVAELRNECLRIAQERVDAAPDVADISDLVDLD